MTKTEKIYMICARLRVGEITTNDATDAILALFKNDKIKCDVCGSTDVIEVPHMGMNCNNCHRL